MATKRQYYTPASPNRGMHSTSSTWHAQTFTPSVQHFIEEVKVKVYRRGTPGIVTVSIRATDVSGHPTGPDLCSGTFDGDTVTTGSSGDEKTISFTSFTLLNPSTKYAIVMRGTHAADTIIWLGKNVGGYGDGNSEKSTDTGVSWSALQTGACSGGCDQWFETYGDPPLSIAHTVALPARALDVALPDRALDVALAARALSVALPVRALTVSLPSRALTVAVKGT